MCSGFGDVIVDGMCHELGFMVYVLCFMCYGFKKMFLCFFYWLWFYGFSFYGLWFYGFMFFYGFMVFQFYGFMVFLVL